MPKNKNSTHPTSLKDEVTVLKSLGAKIGREATSGRYLTTKGEKMPARGGETAFKLGGMTVTIGGTGKAASPAASSLRTHMLVGGPGSKVHTDLAALDAHEPEPDDEAPEFTPEQIEAGVKALAAKRMGRPRLENPKQVVTLRLDPDVVAHFRSGGSGWQTRINDALLRIVKRAR